MGSVSGKIIQGNSSWDYQEVSYGKSRGIHVWGSGQDFTRKFNPNPHNADSKYYNKKQVAWYKEAAKNLLAAYSANQNTWPTQVDVNNVTYTLDQR